jgi:hypothetical protein
MLKSENLGQLRYLTVWPAGLAQPLTSTMNSRDGRTKAAAVIVQTGNNDAISIYASDQDGGISVYAIGEHAAGSRHQRLLRRSRVGRLVAAFGAALPHH